MNNQPLNAPLSAWFRALESGARGRWSRVAKADPYLARVETNTSAERPAQPETSAEGAAEVLEDRSQGHGTSGLSVPTFEERIKQAALKQLIRRRGGF